MNTKITAHLVICCALNIAFFAGGGLAYGQDYIPPKVEANDGTVLSSMNGWTAPNGDKVEWQDDGSVIVTGGPVFFTSGIRKAQENLNDPIRADEMMLVDEAAYSVDAEDSNIEYGIYSDGVIDESDPSGSSYTYDDVNLKVYRRLQNEDGTFDNSATNNYGFEFDKDGLVYGVNYTNVSIPQSWDVLTYDKSGLQWNVNVKSDDYQKLWNRPESVSRWWAIPEAVGIIIIIVIVALTAVEVAGGTLIASIATAITTTTGAAASSATYMAYLAVAISMSVAVNTGLYMSFDLFQDPNADQEGLGVQQKYNSSQEILLPPKISATIEGSKAYNHEIEARSKQVKPCSFDASQQCIRLPFQPVVVQIGVKNAHLKSISIPGSIFNEVTPYQLFDDYYYQLDEFGEIHASASGVLTKAIGSQKFQNATTLPVSIVEPAQSGENVTLAFSDYIGMPYFYLVAKQEPFGFNEFYSIDLGKYGDFGGAQYNLYRYRPKFRDDGSISTVTFPIEPDGPFLAGDNIMIDHPAMHQDVVIANGEYQVIFKDGNGVQQEDAELSVNGDVLIFDTADKDNQNALVATEKWQFYVGSKGTAKGIVAEDFAITGRESYLLPDFVFDPDYSLSPLSEMESYIKKNGHLPYVPSQKDVDDEGFYSIDHMINGQLQNLEELYLQTFRQEEEIQKHKRRQITLKERLNRLQRSVENLENQK